MVLNEDDGGYYNIPSDKIQFSLFNYEINDGLEIPTSFYFKVNDDLVQINITANALTIDHQISFGLFNYWRYHVLTKGTITYNKKTENIDNIQIMDLTTFRLI